MRKTKMKGNKTPQEKEDHDKAFTSLINHPDYEATVSGTTVLVRDKVFTPDPSITHSSQMLTNHLPEMIGKDVIDMGCGTGIISVHCALNNAKSVLAVDSSDQAIANTKENIARHKLDSRVRILKADLFDGINQKFNYVFANLPINDEAWEIHGQETKLVEKFIKQLPMHLKKSGKAYLNWASFGDVDLLQSILKESGCSYREIAEKRLGYTWYLFVIEFSN